MNSAEFLRTATLQKKAGTVSGCFRKQNTIRF